MLSRFRNMSIFYKSLLASGILILLLLVEGVHSILLEVKVGHEIRDVTADLAVDSGIASELLRQVFEQRMQMKQYVETGDPQAVERFRRHKETFRAVLTQAKGAISNPERVELVKAIAAMNEEYSETFAQTVVPNMERRLELVKKVLDVNGRRIEDSLSEVMATAARDRDLEAGYLAGVAQTHLLLARLYVYKYLDSNTTELRQRAVREMELSAEAMQRMDDSLQNRARRGLSELARNLLSGYRQTFAQVVEAIEARNQGIERMDGLGPQIAADANALKDSVFRSLSEQSAEVMAQLRRGERTTVVLITLASVLGALVAWSIARAIVKPLRATSAVLRDIAEGEGDLTTRLPVASDDEVGELAGNFNRFADKLQRIIGVVQSTAGSVASAAEQLSATAVQVRQSARQQADETDQVASAMTEMTTAGEEISRNVDATAEAANATGTDAEQGRQLEAEALAAIEGLSSDIQQAADIVEAVGRHSEDVYSIMAVITDIAEQTNLLALNAAIEAARAGDQGRGFAVVADEVRTLAARTKESTGEIRQTIDGLRDRVAEAVERMRHGRGQTDSVVELAHRMDEALARITEGIMGIGDMSGQIASATQEQSSVSQEINRNVVNLRDLAEGSTTANEQVDASARGLSQLAGELVAQVGQFKVDAA